MTFRLFRTRWGVTALVVASALSAAALTSFAAADGPSPSPSPIPQGCQLQTPQPEAPLALNVVAVRNLVKTLAIEKEVFDCYDAGSTLAQVKEVDTAVELVGRGTSGVKSAEVLPVSKAVDVYTCTKDLKKGGVACGRVAIPLGITSTPLASCSLTKGTYPFEQVTQPTHPLQMATATLGQRLVQTVALEKEVFDCAGQIGDVYLFTEISELADGRGLTSVGTRFEGVVCRKNESAAAVVSCKLFTPSKGKGA